MNIQSLINKTVRKDQKGNKKMKENPEKLATLSKQDEEKQCVGHHYI